MNAKSIPARYKFSGTVLSGGQGDVYVCTDQNLDRSVAIKFIQDIDEIDRLYEEISALQSLRSSHVVDLYDIIPTGTDKKIGLAEEFVGGDDLNSIVQDPSAKEKVDAAAYIKTIYQIARGISDIHGAGIIHRDIKLNNMKFDDEGLVKIFDFGLVKVVGPKAKTKGFKGTFGYAAPELYAAGDDTVVIDQPVDVYAFGASAWLLATGDLPDEMKQTPPLPVPNSILSVRSDLPQNCLTSAPMEQLSGIA